MSASPGRPTRWIVFRILITKLLSVGISNYADAAIPLLGAQRSKINKTRGSSASRYGLKSASNESIGPVPNVEFMARRISPRLPRSVDGNPLPPSSRRCRYGAGPMPEDLQRLEK
jgi:hypothetical protein